jgi:GNAT superfamily N-acetyltransferase
MNIRQIGVDDRQVVAGLWVEMVAELNAHDRPRLQGERHEIEQYIAEQLPTGTFAAWVAEERGKAVSTAALISYPIPPRGNSKYEAVVINVFTLAAWRGRGLATELMRELLSYARSQPIRRVWLRSTEPARPIYERVGFVGDPTFLRIELDPTVAQPYPRAKR